MNSIRFKTEVTDNNKKLIQSHINNDEFSICDFLIKNFDIDITNDQDIIANFERDWSNIPGYADYLARPTNDKQCAILLYIFNELKIPITISAGKTNLTGSATPMGGLVLSVVNMKLPGILINKNKQTVSTGVGIVLEDMRNEILDQTNNMLYYPVDPTSRKDALIGGTISCNASGFIPGDKGATRYWVNKIKIILPNGYSKHITRGEFISKNSQFYLECDNKNILVDVPNYHRPKIKNASGPFTSDCDEIDFIDLMIGSEGIFSLITEVEFAITKTAKQYLDLFITLRTEKNAIQLRGYLEEQGILDELTALEYFGYNCQNYMDHKEKLFKNNSSVGIYIQYPIFKESMDIVIEKWIDLLDNSSCQISDNDIILLNSPENWRMFFEARHSMPAIAVEKTKELDAISLITDTIVPYENFNQFLDFAHSILQNNKIEYLLFGHLGDCHLHFHVIYTKKQTKIIKDIYQKIIRESAKLGGVYSAEHGTGKRKTIDFLECYGEDAIKQVQKCKLSFDPNNILNQGNIINIKGV